MELGFATRPAIEKMVALEATKVEHLARVAELITISDEEFARRLSEPVEPPLQEEPAGEGKG